MAADNRTKTDNLTNAEACALLSDEDMGAALAATIASAILIGSFSTTDKSEGKRLVQAIATELVRDIRAGERSRLANQIKGSAIAKGMIS